MIPAFLQLIAVGFVAGSVGALLGVGGGVILVPGLILVSGLPFRAAVAASLVCVVATSVAGSAVYLRRDRVDLDLAVELQLFTVLGAVLAGLVAALLPAAPLYLGFALLLVVMALRMWPRGAAPAQRDQAALRHRRPLARGASVGTGLVSGLLGVGGGVLNVPILHLLLGISFDRAVATSVYIIGVTAGAAALVYLARGDVQPAVAGSAMVGTLAGAGLAAIVGQRLDQRVLKAAFALLLLYIAFRMGSRGFATL